MYGDWEGMYKGFGEGAFRQDRHQMAEVIYRD